MTTNLEQAHERIDEMEFTDQEQEYIFSDWSNWNEHIEWLLTATREEIEDWINL